MSLPNSNFLARSSSFSSSSSDDDNGDGNNKKVAHESPPPPPPLPIDASGYSTPPRQPILTVDDPALAWEEVKADQIFLPVPTRVGPPDPSRYLRVVCMSDTHGYHRSISVPGGDILLHGGDFTNYGEPEMVEDVCSYFNELQQSGIVRRVFCIAGNHELTFQPERYCRVWKNFLHGRRREPYDAAAARAALKHCTYLEDEGVSVGGVKLYGSPWQPYFYDWAFNCHRTDIGDKWDLIPSDTDILATHGPPLGRGDVSSGGQRVGCVELMRAVQTRVKPRLHVFGHIHEGYGVSYDGDTLYVNASNVGQNYKSHHSCIVVDVPLDSSSPALMVQPQCDLDRNGLVDWLRDNSFDKTAEHVEKAGKNILGETFIADNGYGELCDMLLLHRDDAARKELKRAIMKLRAESY
mmetsp:Transcript_14871/g.32353  ORF Transcript_14871/g.32353 Transcript_14871/m.32353 type:complete len:409 (-) Transcript_14871:201-1427(-)|eukprot:CAMPEP_0178470250 /NCGR_PEP_ID=MMETSP0696-20121128/429_1 /TAXON_ID=265572 /ORGANISM="Extubocellulus spinifer, Strain CCMP396" /LENGTH=408 /DNA_ID=CAMNT_0020097345 /DNA_START=90 /DNA_END=1316 /DNA_ORIENTATION=+